MAGMAPPGSGAPEPVTQRSRWATRRMTTKSSSAKRFSLLGRLNAKGLASEKKRASGGTDSSQSAGGTQKDSGSIASDGGGGPAPRKLYFNLPLPPELQDDEGHPIQRFTRNKIRTAKYTPLSFIPKNLWFQFHNIANIFFLFLVILVVSSAGPSPRATGVQPAHAERRELTESEL